MEGTNAVIFCSSARKKQLDFIKSWSCFWRLNHFTNTHPCCAVYVSHFDLLSSSTKWQTVKISYLQAVKHSSSCHSSFGLLHLGVHLSISKNSFQGSGKPSALSVSKDLLITARVVSIKHFRGQNSLNVDMKGTVYVNTYQQYSYHEQMTMLSRVTLYILRHSCNKLDEMRSGVKSWHSYKL